MRALEGVYATHCAGGPLDERQEGQEVTVIHVARGSSQHMLDLAPLQRADAAQRRR
jgi:hypothetical protein